MSTNKLKTDKARDHKLWLMCFFYYIYSFLKKMDKKVECYLRRPAIPSPFYRGSHTTRCRGVIAGRRKLKIV